MTYDYNRQARSSVLPDNVKKDLKKTHDLLADLVKAFDRLHASTEAADKDLGKKQVAAQVAQEMGKQQDGPDTQELNRAIHFLRNVRTLGHYNSNSNQMDLKSLAEHVRDMQRL